MDARFAQAYTGQPKWVCTCDNSAAQLVQCLPLVMLLYAKLVGKLFEVFTFYKISGFRGLFIYFLILSSRTNSPFRPDIEEKVGCRVSGGALSRGLLHLLGVRQVDVDYVHLPCLFRRKGH